MEISVSPKTKRLIDKASEKLNLDSESAIYLILESYLKVSEDPELAEELEMWEKAGVEDLNDFLEENEL